MMQDEITSLAGVTALRELKGALHGTNRHELDSGLADLNAKPARADHWAKTLGLVDKAAEALDVAEQRIRALEARHAELVRVTKHQLQSAQASINAAEVRALDAEHLADEAEKEAKQSREWLTQIHDGLEQLPKADKLPSLPDAPQGSAGNRSATNPAGLREWPDLGARARR